jgi:hypothetical protein
LRLCGVLAAQATGAARRLRFCSLSVGLRVGEGGGEMGRHACVSVRGLGVR